MHMKKDKTETSPPLITIDRGHLQNYRELRAKIDILCRKIVEEFSAQLACRAGCDGCCRHISLFWVEAVALAAALHELPAAEATRIRALAAGASPDGPCPLLENGLCLLYESRPIICRTHGLPLLALQDGKRTVDFCPENFQGLASLPGSAVIDIDRLNTTLAAINALFVADLFHGSPPGKERLTIAEALELAL
jgi:uncharacterized protein